MYNLRQKNYNSADIKITVDGLSLPDIVKRIINKLQKTMRKIKKLNVKLGTENSYPIYIGDNLLINFPSYINQFKNYSKIIIVTDKNVNRYYKKILLNLKNLGEKLVVEIMSSGEKTKSFKSLAFLCENIFKKN